MSLSARLDSPLALYRKLEREAYRAFHAKTPLTKADHFFNFCVSAASMRDYVLEHLGKVEDADKQPYHDEWSKEAALVATVEIANSAKHFVLRERNTKKPRHTRTRAVEMKKTSFVDIYRNDVGELKAVESQRTEVSITLSDGRAVELYAFTTDVLAYWKKFLSSEGFVVRRQPLSRLAAG